MPYYPQIPLMDIQEDQSKGVLDVTPADIQRTAREKRCPRQ